MEGKELQELDQNNQFDLNQFQSPQGPEYQKAQIASPFELDQDNKNPINLEGDTQHAQLEGSFSRPNSNVKTVFALANTQIGTGCLLLPLIYKDTGIFIGILATVVVASSLRLTASILLSHNKEYENDITTTIYRILGKKFVKVWTVGAGLFMFFGSIGFFLLSSNLLFLIIRFFLERSGQESYGKTDDVTFKKFSYQYTVIALAIVFFFLSLLKNISIIIKITNYGFITIISFLIFIFYVFIDNVFIENNLGKDMDYWKENPPNGKPDTVQTEINFISSNIGSVFGTLAFFLACHSYSQPILAKNRQQHKNNKLITITFCISCFVYMYVGILGYLSIYGKLLPADTESASQVLDFYKVDEIPTLIISILFFLDLFSVYPTLFYVAKENLLKSIYGYSEIPDLHNFVFVIIITIVNLVCGIFNYSPSVFIDIAGSVIGLVLQYFIPICLHLGCIHRNDVFFAKFINYGKLEPCLYYEPKMLQYQANETEKGMNEVESKPQVHHSQKFECKHQTYISKTCGKNRRYLGFAIVFLFGIFVLIQQLISLVSAF